MFTVSLVLEKNALVCSLYLLPERMLGTTDVLRDLL